MTTKVLIIGHIGKPIGGLSIYYESLLKSSLLTKVDIAFIDSMTGTNTYAERGNLSFATLNNIFLLIYKFSTTMMQFRPDIIDIASAYGGSFLKNSLLIIISRILRKRVILRPRCSIKMFIPIAPSFWRNYILAILNMCNGIIVLSSEWEELNSIVPNANIRLFPNAIDLSLLSVIRRNTYEKINVVNILYLGHIGKEKGIYELIDSIKILKGKSLNIFHLDLVGESLKVGELDDIRMKIKTNSLEELITIYPTVYGTQKNEFLANADIFVLPSYHEGMPISIIEAMASGLAIIATSVGGIPDMILNRKTGLLINPQDTEELVDALFTLIINPEMRNQLGCAARAYAIKNHEIENFLDDLVSYYIDIIST